MKTVELYARVRHAVLIEGISERAAADRFGINARTVSKMLKFSVPPGYVRRKPPFRPKLNAFTGVIDAILAADKDRPKKQRHTSKRIFERLRDERGFHGQDHDREGLRCRLAPADAGDVRAACASARACPGRLRRSDRGDRLCRVAHPEDRVGVRQKSIVEERERAHVPVAERFRRRAAVDPL